MVGALATGTLHFGNARAADNVPPIGGDYAGGANVVAIPTDDPEVKVISGALFKPSETGPFPAVIYMSGCAGLGPPSEVAMEKVVIDHMLSKGVATLIVDPFTPRHEDQGVCDKAGAGPEVYIRGVKDVHAARNLLAKMPDIDQKHVFLQGYSYGAIISLMATDAANAASADIGVAGVVAYYPYCGPASARRAVPTLVLIGDKDDWTPAKLCEAIPDKANLEIVVYPDATHGFAMPMDQPVDYMGHHIAYDDKATKDAQGRVDTFMAAHMK
jgi:dienelactone hydrolase